MMKTTPDLFPGTGADIFPCDDTGCEEFLFRDLVAKLCPEFLELEIIQLVREEPAAPRPPVNPGDDLFDHIGSSAAAPDRHQFAPDLRVSPPAPSHRDKVVGT